MSRTNSTSLLSKKISRSSHLMPFRKYKIYGCSEFQFNWIVALINIRLCHSIPTQFPLNFFISIYPSISLSCSLLVYRGDRDTDQSKIKQEIKLKIHNLHFWFWPLRKAFRLWWRTFDLTNCTSTLYHHFDSSWHVPFTNVDESGVWMRIEWMWPVICSASATSIVSVMLMLACGIVSGCEINTWLISH